MAEVSYTAVTVIALKRRVAELEARVAELELQRLRGIGSLGRLGQSYPSFDSPENVERRSQLWRKFQTFVAENADILPADEPS